MVFPDVRSKNFLEIRSGDALPYPYNIGYAAFWKGLLYNESNLDTMYKEAKECSKEDMDKLRQSVTESGIDTILPHRNETLIEGFERYLKLSRNGLTNDETKHLVVIEEMVANRVTPRTMTLNDLYKGKAEALCDPRNLVYTEGKLYYHKEKIDLIYRRATTIRLVEEAEHIQDFIQAYKDGAVCVVGGMVSQMIHDKKIFAVLHDTEKLPFLDVEELEFIKRHVPYTAILHQSDSELIEKVIGNKDSMVLKPFDQYAAHGVHIGRDFDSTEWKRLVEKAVQDNYLVQEFSVPLQIEMPTIQGDTLIFEKYNCLLGLFMYNQQFKGIYSRAGRRNIIASIAESFTIPNFIYKDLDSTSVLQKPYLKP